MNIIVFYTKALDAVAKGKWLQNTQTYESIVWKNPSDTVSKEIIDAKVAELQAAYEATQYQRDRALLYPELKEQLDLLYHDMTNDKGDKTGEWYKAVNKVKTDIPKPE